MRHWVQVLVPPTLAPPILFHRIPGARSNNRAGTLLSRCLPIPVPLPTHCPMSLSSHRSHLPMPLPTHYLMTLSSHRSHLLMSLPTHYLVTLSSHRSHLLVPLPTHCLMTLLSHHSHLPVPLPTHCRTTLSSHHLRLPVPPFSLSPVLSPSLFCISCHLSDILKFVVTVWKPNLDHVARNESCSRCIHCCGL